MRLTDPVALGTESASPTDRGAGTAALTGRITDVAAVQAQASGMPGEFAGPAVAVTVELNNRSASDVDLSTVTVTMTDAAGNPTVALSVAPADPFAGTLRRGQSAKGVYLFAVAPERRSPVTVELSFVGSGPIAQFVGDAPA